MKEPPGVVYYHLLLRRETRIPGVAPFSFRIGIWDLFVHGGQKLYTPTAFGKLWTTPGVRCMKHASSCLDSLDIAIALFVEVYNQSRSCGNSLWNRLSEVQKSTTNFKFKKCIQQLLYWQWYLTGLT